MTTKPTDVQAELDDLIALEERCLASEKHIDRFRNIRTNFAALVEAAECARVAMSAVAVPNPAERAILQEGADILSAALKAIGHG